MAPRKLLISALRVLAVLLALGGIAWFVASLTYDDEQPRMQANEGPAAAADVMDQLRDFYAEHRRLPVSGEFQMPAPPAVKHVAAIILTADYSLIIVYTGRRQIEGKSLTLRPYTDAQRGLRWHCESADIDPRWWPDYCRQDTAP
jgi:hypothetical protein